MPSADVAASDEATNVERLVCAADAALRDNGVEDVTIEAVAAAAGVSRATAFRLLGKRDDMVVTVALRRAAGYAQTCMDEMSRHDGTMGQIEAAFRFLTQEIPTDPVIRELLAIRTAEDLDSDVHDIATATLGPALERGRLAGEIRTDVPVSDIVTWTVEQLYLAMQQNDRSDRAIVSRVRSFLAPALSPRLHTDDALRIRVNAVSAALEETRRAVAALQEDAP